MSSPTPNTTTETIQYIYIPNLVGKQILRVPVLPCEEQILSTTPGLSLSADSTSAPAPQPLSRTSSWGSVSEEE